MTYCHALVKTSAPGVIIFTILVDPSLVIISVYFVCSIYLREERTILKEILHFQYITYKDTPLHKNSCPGGHEIYNFGRPFLGDHNYLLSLSVLCL